MKRKKKRKRKRKRRRRRRGKKEGEEEEEAVNAFALPSMSTFHHFKENSQPVT